MASKSGLFTAGASLVAAIAVSGCNGDDHVPVGPSPTQSRVVGAWNLTVRVTESLGQGCVADALRAEINTHNQYSLSIVERGNITEAVLASASGDFECTYPTLVDSAGFSEAPGTYRCSRERRVMNCGGLEHPLSTFGQSLSGRFSGSQVSGEWSAFWEDLVDDHDVEMKAQFTGTAR